MITIANADARHIPLPDKSVQCVVTSPPYWGLRDYGVSDQIGLEPTPAAYVANIVAVMRECWRVLKDDGVLWLNLGDSYSGSSMEGGTGKRTIRKNGDTPHSSMKGEDGDIRFLAKKNTGLKPKDLCGIPWRVAFALQDDRWYLRQDIIWSKPNPMPESVTDRCTKAHEYVFLLSKKSKYYYDFEAIAEPMLRPEDADGTMIFGGQKAIDAKEAGAVSAQLGRMSGTVWKSTRTTKNKRDVWTIPNAPYSGAHFATFPPALIEPMILAGSRRGDVVLDPFGGSGTTGQVAVKHGRRAVLLDLNTKYIDLQFDRTSGVQITMPV